MATSDSDLKPYLTLGLRNNGKKRPLPPPMGKPKSLITDFQCSIPYPIPESSNSDASLTQEKTMVPPPTEGKNLDGKTLCFRVENGKIVSPPSGGENSEGTTLYPKWLREIHDVRVPRLPMPSEIPPEFCDWILALDEKSQKALHTSIQKYFVLLRKEFWSDREERFDLTLLERVVGSRAREALVETEWLGFVARLTWDEANKLQDLHEVVAMDEARTLVMA